MSTSLPSLDALIENFLICCMTEGKSEKIAVGHTDNFY